MSATQPLRATPRWCASAVLYCALASTLPAFAQAIDTIELNFRTAEEVIPVLQPLVEPGGVLTGSGDVLLVRASAANVRQLRDALALLDRPPRQLLITVGQSTTARDSDTSLRGSATIGQGDVQVGINRPTGQDAGAAVAVRSHMGRDDIRNVSSVRTLEGSEAYVMAGESRPFTSVTVAPGWPGQVVSRSTEYRAVQTGFYVTPRIAGDRVTLVISPQQQQVQVTRHGDAIATQGAATTVTGHLGEWIPLGGLRQSDDRSTSGLATWSTHSESTGYAAWVKVDALP